MVNSDRRLKIGIVILLLMALFAISAIIFLRHIYVFPILMYHSIDYNDKETKLSVTPEAFRRQMEFLHKNNYNVVGLDKAIKYISGEEKAPPKTVAITFDDGLLNNYEYAYPVLKEYGLPAAIFVIIKQVGQPGWLTWGQIKEMSDSGVITIGSHTVSHAWLPDTDDEKIMHELTGSKAILEEKTGKSVDFLAYPIGAHDERVKKAVKEAGYKGAFGTNPGRLAPSKDIYAVKRLRISRTSNNMFVFWIESSGYYTWLKEHRDAK